MPVAARRALRLAGFAAALALAYTGGVATGVVGSREPPASGVLDEAAERLAAGAAEPVTRESLRRAAVDGMLRALNDSWSSYYPPREAAAASSTIEGRYTGVGLWLRPGGATGIQVGSVQAHSPAAVAGVVIGDAVVTVDGRAFAPGDVAGAAAALRGTAGAAPGRVELVVRNDGRNRRLTLARATFAASDVAVERLPAGVALVRVAAFTRGVGREVRRALPAANRPAGGVVLDLRGNPGGLVTEAVEVASLWLDGGTVVAYERRGEPRRELAALGKGDTTTPLVVLVDAGTASAAEIVAAALQERGRAVIVGGRTYGKGSVQEPTRLSDGSALEFTVGRYLTPSGRSLEGLGLEPDVVVSAAAAPVVAEQRATEVLRGLVATLPGRG